MGVVSEAGLLLPTQMRGTPTAFVHCPPATGTQVALNLVAALQSLARMTLPSTAPGLSLSRSAAIGFGLAEMRSGTSGLVCAQACNCRGWRVEH